jgi:arsenical pump membrane protein
MATAGARETAAVGAVVSVCLNNLPAAVMLAGRRPPHRGALLVGLNLGPNLAVSGSLAAVLWLRAARGSGARPSPARYARIGLVLAPLSMAAALAGLAIVAPHGL